LEYSIDSINILPFPDSRTSKGKWQQEWLFSLLNPFDGNGLDQLSKELSVEDFSVILRSSDAKNFKMSIISTRDTASPEVYALVCRTFVKVEKVMGKLDCIQEQRRNLWFPFRHETPKKEAL
jgi:hypothetical protein